MLDRDVPHIRRLEAPDVPAFIDAIAPRDLRVLAGLDAASLADLLATGPAPRFSRLKSSCR